MLKRYLISAALILLAIPQAVSAQNRYDALRYSQQFYSGTARSLSMGNAMTSLGGDMGAITVNPAAAGVYRYMEIAITPGVYTGTDHSEYLGYSTGENRSRFILSNIGWVGSFETGRKRGLLSMNVGLVANQTNNFASRTSLHGEEATSSYLASMASQLWESQYPASRLGRPASDPDYPFFYSDASWASILAWDTYLLDTLGGNYNYLGATENIDSAGDPYVGGILNQNYYKETSGYTQDVTLNISGNVSDKLFFGVNLTMQSIWYNQTSTYTEAAQNPNDFETGFVSMRHRYTQTSSGYGFNLKAGLLYRPIAGLSIGASISTPTWIAMTDRWDEGMEAQYLDDSFSSTSPEGRYNYRITTPFRWNIGVGYTFGKIAVISADYEWADYSKIKMSSSEGAFYDENQSIKDGFKSTNNVRVGAEVRVHPQFSLRAGYNFYDNPEKDYVSERHYVSFGAGYRSKGGFFLDAAYQQQCNRTTEYYTLYSDYDTANGVPLAKSQYLNWQLLLTLGFRF